MEPKTQKISLVDGLREILDNHVSKEDVTSAFEQVLKYNEHAHAKTKAEVDKILESLQTVFDEIRAANDRVVSLHNDTLGKQHANLLGRLERAIASRLAELKDGERGEKGESGKDADENKVFARVMDMLAKKKLSLADIDGWDEFFAEFKKVKNRPTAIGGWSAAGGGKIVKSYDLSSSLNGVLSTFSLPAFWRVISVHISSAPNILEPTTDYTTNASTMQITFGASISPATQLASGQTCIVVYSEP